MTLRFALEPANGAQLVRDALSRIVARTSAHAPAPRALGGVTPSALQVMSPHAIYDLRADDLARGGGLEAAQASAIRYPVRVGGQPVAAAEVLVDASGQARLVANINYGPFVAATDRAFGALASSALIAGQSYEARVLRCAAIPVLAIWLKADGSGADWIYPLAPAPSGVPTEQLCQVDDFLRTIRPIAQQRAASHPARSVP